MIPLWERVKPMPKDEIEKPSWKEAMRGKCMFCQNRDPLTPGNGVKSRCQKPSEGISARHGNYPDDYDLTTLTGDCPNWELRKW